MNIHIYHYDSDFTLQDKPVRECATADEAASYCQEESVNQPERVYVACEVVSGGKNLLFRFQQGRRLAKRQYFITDEVDCG